MKKIMFVFVLLVGFALAGCQTADPSHKTAVVLFTKIAINHLGIEKELALEECAEDEIPPEDCDDALDYERWATTLSMFEKHFEDADYLMIGAEEIDLIVDAVIAEMGDDFDPRTMAYIQDIKIVLQMMLREKELAEFK